MGIEKIGRPHLGVVSTGVLREAALTTANVKSSSRDCNPNNYTSIHTALAIVFTLVLLLEKYF